MITFTERIVSLDITLDLDHLVDVCHVGNTVFCLQTYSL